MEESVQFSLTHSDSLSNEQYSVYAILIFPPNETSKDPQTVALLPVDRETLDINIVNVWGHIMPIGIRAETVEGSEDEVSSESIRDVIIPNILMLLSMTITGYNFLDPQAQAMFEMETKLDVPTDELPKAEEFTFDTVEDLFKALDED